MSLEKLVKEKIKEPTNDVFAIEFEGKKVWVKKAKVSGSNLLQHLAYKLFKNSLLVPSKKQTPTECIHNESSRLKTIHEKFSHVPEVLWVDDEFMVMGDTGRDLRSILDSLTDKEEIESLIYKALDVLIALHKQGFFHGGSQIKNMTLKDEKIYLIDFEEKFVDADIDDLQFRDLFLFLISISKLNYDLYYKKIIDIYVEKTSKSGFYKRFDNIIKSAGFLMKLLSNEAIFKKMDKDTKSVYRLFATLKR
ncbi:MAG: hypothetical protein JXQ66_08060 [Campylobacterales bacterium]|nr:hypothetical protein [Campylobacterales bacterium]